MGYPGPSSLAAAPPPPFLEGGLISPLAPYIKRASPCNCCTTRNTRSNTKGNTWRPLPLRHTLHLSPFSPVWLPGLELHRFEGLLLHRCTPSCCGKSPEGSGIDLISG